MHGKHSLWFVGLMVLASIAGCIPSENGLCPDDGGDQATFDPALLGPWVSHDPSSGEDHVTRVERLKDGLKTYVFRTEPETDANKESPVVGHMVPIGKRLYIDFFILNPQKPDQKYHAFAQVELTKSNLAIHWMDPSYLTKHPEGLAHRREPNDHPDSAPIDVITASTVDLRAFLESHPADPQLWTEQGIQKYHRP